MTKRTDKEVYDKAFQDYLRGFSLEEIQQRRGVAEGTLKSWMYRDKWKDRKEGLFDKEGNIIPELLSKCTDGNVIPVYDKNNPEEYAYGTPHDLKLAKSVRNSLHHALGYFTNSPPATDDETQRRLQSYLEVCLSNEIIPTVEGLWLCLGISRMTFEGWRGGKLGTVRAALIEKSLLCVQYVMTQVALSGNIPTSLYTLIGKNFFDLKDKTETEITHHKDNGDTATPEEIAERLNNVPQEDSKPIIDVDFDEVDT